MYTEGVNEQWKHGQNDQSFNLLQCSLHSLGGYNKPVYV